MLEKSRPVTYVRGEVVVILFVLLAACSKPDEHTNRSVIKEVGEFRFTVKYEPPENDREGNKNEVEYFKVKLEKNDDQDVVQYLSNISGFTKEEVLYYLSYRLKDEIFLEQGSKRERSVLYHFERSFDLKSGRVINVGFAPSLESKEELTLLIDSDLLNVGPVKFKF